MVTLADVRRWDPAALEAAQASLGATRDRLVDLDHELARARPAEADWSGAAADAARTGHDALAERLRHLVAGATAARIALADAADEVTAIRRQIGAAENDATARGFAIAADGTVTDTRQTVLPADQVEQYQQQRRVEQAGVVDALRAAIDRAAALDARLLDSMTRVADDRIDDGRSGSLGDAALSATGPGSEPPADGTPQQNADWWRGLSAAEQENVLLAHPDRIGNLDGVPAAVRDEANRARLPGEIARVDRALAEATARRDGAMDEFTASTALLEVERLTNQRDALQAVSHTIDRPDRHLLLLDVDGGAQPRAAVAVGDIDTADNVAVFTPGFTSTVATSLDGYTESMTDLRTSADQLAAARGGGSSATVAWMGYDAPQVTNMANPTQSVLAPLAARTGGDQLAHFYQGITAARPDRDTHLTALGHSYGSTTTGYALQQAPVDDAVFFGSPGLSTSNVADLRVPDGHTAVIEARDDFVADLASFGRDPNHLPGVTSLQSGTATGPDGRQLLESTGHSEYLAPGTTSQHNLAATVAGLPDQRVTGQNTGLGDYISDPVQAGR